jgi:hypothetical protein
MLLCKIKLSKAPTLDQKLHAHDPNMNTTEGIQLSSTTELKCCQTRILSLNLNEPMGPQKNLIRIKLLPGNDRVTSSWTLNSSIWDLKNFILLAQNTPSPATPGSNAPGAKHFSPGATAKKKCGSLHFACLCIVHVQAIGSSTGN